MISVKFSDGELVQFEKGWNDLPKKPIVRVKIIIDKHVMIMEGYEEYNHLQEHVMGIFDGKQSLRYRYLLGRIGNNVQGIRYNYITDQIEEFEAEIGKEYNDRPSSGWKKGMKLEETSFLYF